MFELQSIDPRCIGYFDIVMVVVIIEFIDNADPERVGVSKGAIIDACHIEVAGKTQVAFGFQYRIDLYQALTDKIPFAAVIRSLFP